MLTAEEARNQQENALKGCPSISEVLDEIDRHTQDPDKEDNFIWWYGGLDKQQQNKLLALGYKVVPKNNRNEIDYRISW